MLKIKNFSKFFIISSFFNLFLHAQEATEIESEKVFPVEDYQASLWKMFLMVSFLVAFLILTVWLLKKFLNLRMNTSAQGKAIQILEKRSVSPKSILYLIEVEGEKFLISESQVQIQKIERLKVPLQSSE